MPIWFFDLRSKYKWHNWFVYCLETLALLGVGLPHVAHDMSFFTILFTCCQWIHCLPPPHQPSIPCQTSPYLQCTCNSHQFLEQNRKLVEQVLAVLDFMHSTDVTLSTLLWAVSWGVEEPNSNHMVIFECMNLLVSDELPEILNNWFKPPWWHSAGIYTEAGQHPLVQWAFKTVSSSIECEIVELAPTVHSGR